MIIDSALQSGRPFRSLDEISKEYERTEITSIFIHDIQNNLYTNLFSVAEMCPVEQKQSHLIASRDTAGKECPQARKSLKNKKTVYIVRRIFDDTAEAIRFFRGQDGCHIIPDKPEEIQVREATYFTVRKLPRTRCL